MRTTRSGSARPTTGVTPGSRRPVRTITLPSTCSRRIRFGEPTSSAPSGVIVAALRPRPGVAHRGGGLDHDLVGGRSPVLQREVEALELELEPEQAGIEDAQRLLEQLLAGLVALEDHDLDRSGTGRTIANGVARGAGYAAGISSSRRSV